MAESAATVKYGKLEEKDLDKIKAHSALADNIGNFFGQKLIYGKLRYPFNSWYFRFFRNDC